MIRREALQNSPQYTPLRLDLVERYLTSKQFLAKKSQIVQTMANTGAYERQHREGSSDVFPALYHIHRIPQLR